MAPSFHFPRWHIPRAQAAERSGRTDGITLVETLAQLELERGSGIPRLNVSRSPESPAAPTPTCHPAFKSELIRVSPSTRERSRIAKVLYRVHFSGFG